MELVLWMIAGVALAYAMYLAYEPSNKKNVPFKPNAVDADKDGIIQEGTEWERLAPAAAPKKKAPAKKAPAKKAPAKKKPAPKKK